MKEPPARVVTIPANRSFVDVIAASLLAKTKDDPGALAAHTILLPTRRAVRNLREAFLRASGGQPLLLPRMRPIGDVNEEELILEEEGIGLDLPPAIDPLRRQVMLARMILAKDTAEGGTRDATQAVALAGALAEFLDRAQAERLSFDALADLVPSDLAAHWQEVLKFLALVTTLWPRVLAERGEIDPADRRNRLIEALAAAWRERPPRKPVIAAGSTGSLPATADLIALVATLPQGLVILPGLDGELDEAAWGAIDPQHPQFGLKRLLEKMKIERSDVPSWPGPAPSARLAALSFALRPAAATEAWRERAPDPDGYAGLSRLDAPTPREEAAAIALLMREALETPGKRAALITPDRGLARRVAAELLRWDIAIDDSAGTPLGQTPPGIFFRLIAAAAVEPGDPHVLLSLLQHPFCRLGLPAATHKALLHRFDAELRGPRPGDDLAAYRRIVESDTELAAWADAWIGALTPLVTAIQAGAEGPAILAVHRRAAETLAREEGADAARLYAGEDGHALAAFIDDLAGLADLLPRPSEASWAALIDELMAGRVVRPRFGTHPRLAILGPLEARLQQVERVILGGLNEGTWPADPGVDPWMSRPMRARFGLPESERRIGLAAHDFVAFAAAPEAILTRGLKADGAPTVPSRWLLRLEAACGPIPSAMDWVERARLLDHVPISRPCLPPAPRPPVSARPPGLSVTDIETWMRNPYAIHARHILRLSALDPIDQDPGRAELGSFVHRALAAFLGAVQESWPEDALAVLLREGERAFGSSLARPGIRAFWWPRFVRIAAWVVATEMERRPGSWPIAWERKGSLALGDFTLRARADRIDRLAGGGIALIDYKTGTPPKKEDIARGFSPQLPLEGLIAEAGGFTGVDRATVGELAIWHLQGGAEAGKIIPVDGPDGAIARARAGLAALIAKFADPATPYLAVPRRAHRPRYDDYAHLARIAEWSDEVTP